MSVGTAGSCDQANLAGGHDCQHLSTCDANLPLSASADALRDGYICHCVDGWQGNRCNICPGGAQGGEVIDGVFHEICKADADGDGH